MFVRVLLETDECFCGSSQSVGAGIVCFRRMLKTLRLPSSDAGISKQNKTKVLIMLANMWTPRESKY